MVCGSKRYVVEAEVEGKVTSKNIVARTPAEARKRCRAKYGAHMNIKTVRENK